MILQPGVRSLSIQIFQMNWKSIVQIIQQAVIQIAVMITMIVQATIGVAMIHGIQDQLIGDLTGRKGKI